MDSRRIASDFWVARQITAADVGVAAARGVRAIICNRPRHEAPPTCEPQAPRKAS